MPGKLRGLSLKQNWVGSEARTALSALGQCWNGEVAAGIVCMFTHPLVHTVQQLADARSEILASCLAAPPRVPLGAVCEGGSFRCRDST